MIHTGIFERMEVYHNIYGETPEKIKAKKGCTTILNGILFNGDGSLCCDIRINGKWIANDQYTYFGLGWSGNEMPKLVHTNDAGKYENFLSCVPVQPNSKRGRSAVGFKGITYTTLCTSDFNGAMTIPEVEAIMQANCEVYLIVDGGGSSFEDCPSGKVDTSYARKTANKTYILIWEKSADKPTDKGGDKTMKVCLDAGHGTKEMNQSPDGTYLEHEFAIDMAKRIRVHLERCGVDVKLTREDSSTPSLTERATIANKYGANLFVSLHSNATGGTGWKDSAHGLSVWTYAVGGERDKAAVALLAQMAIAGVETFGSKLYHSNFTVLAKTNMPAYLVEYAFHTCHNDVVLLKSDSHRAKLAIATAKSICAYGGVKWLDEPAKQTITYKIQIDLTDETAAENLADELTAKGYKPYITTEVK